MLLYLKIKDFGIFTSADVELGPGLSVFTGETGAGKSMIVDAVMACLGQRTSKDFIRGGGERAIVQLLVEAPDPVPADLETDCQPSDEILLQRDILPERSYMRINNRLATATMAQTIGSRLVDIHGQQEHHSLLRPEGYIHMLDSMDRKATDLTTRFSRLYQDRQDILSKIRKLGELKDHSREAELLSHQIREIEKANLAPGEEEELRDRFRLLSASERLVELSSRAYDLLYEGSEEKSAFAAIEQSRGLLESVFATDPSCKGAYEALSEVSYGLEVAVDLLREYRDALDLDPDELARVSDRLDLIQRLKSKYGPTLSHVLDYLGKARTRLRELQSAGESLEQLKNSLKMVESDMGRVGRELTCAREAAAKAMGQEVSRTLTELGMAGAEFVVGLETENDPGGITLGNVRKRVFPHGFDRVSFLFSANPGQAPLPVHRVASGGELSRLMLAIKSYMEKSDPVPTLIFDEIDSGVGGRAGQAVAKKLWHLGRSHQVLCVTHLASIAAMADHHYLVSKREEAGQTYASVQMLSDAERPSEISRMLSGSEHTASKAHAQELLREATEYKKSFPS